MLVSPEFLIASALGAAVPLVLHLLRHRRKVRMPFPTLRFLKRAEKQSSRRLRIEHLLLWLLRTLIMVLLGLAFAMPTLRSRGFAFLGAAPRDVTIVIDASYSMHYRTGMATVWEKALDAASAIVNGLGENDRFCLYLAHEHPEPVIAEPVGDKEAGLGRLKELRAGHGSSRLAPALTAAHEALRKGPRGRERELHVITDNQALPWEDFGRSGEDGTEWKPGELGDRTPVFVTLLGVPAPENVFPVSIDLQPPLLLQGSSARITAQLSHCGAVPRTTLALYVDEQEIGRRQVLLETADADAPSFIIPPLPSGTHAGRVETPDDNLPEDNSFHFLIRVEDQLRALCVGTEEDTLFIRAALKAGAAGGSGMTAGRVDPDGLVAEALEEYAAVFLCNALPLPGQALTALESYLRGGGLVVLFPGSRAVVEDYQALTFLPAVPSAIAELPWSERNRVLTWNQPRHTLLRPLQEAMAKPNVTIRRSLRWEDVPGQTSRLISMGPEQPFLLERSLGRGRALLYAVSADRTWSDFPLSPYYPPLALRALEYGAGAAAFSPYLWSTASLPLAEHLPEAGPAAVILGPDGSRVPLRSSLAEGRTVLQAEHLHLPGLYTWSPSNGVEAIPALAINLPRRESDLTPIAPREITRRLGVDAVRLANDRASLLRAIEDHRIGRSYGEHVLWAVLLLIALEFFYANRLLQSRPSLIQKLAVSEAGGVKGRASATASTRKGRST